MNPLISSLLVGAFLPVALIGTLSSNDVPAASGPAPFHVLSAEPTAMGCRITVRAANLGTSRVAVSRDSQVRSKAGPFWGPWKKLGKSVWITPRKHGSWTYNLAYGCNVARRYRFLVKKFNSRNEVTGEAYVHLDKTFDKELHLGNLAYVLR